jgi:hypothetical protein
MIGTRAVRPALAAAPATGPGTLIGRRAAQRLATHELAELYKEPLWYRILVDIERLFGVTRSAVPAGWFGLILLAVLVAIAIVVILTWVRPTMRRRVLAGAVLGGQARTASQYRTEAARLAAGLDYGGAIVEGVRAIAAELEERGILRPRPSRTANELAAQAGLQLPDLAPDLSTVTRLFDDVRYGDRPGTRAGYELVTRVDARTRTAAPASADAEGPQASPLGVPR